MKIAWSTQEESIAFVSTRGGFVQKWDIRVPGGVPVLSTSLSVDNAAIADMELRDHQNKLTVAYSKKVNS